MLQQVSLRNFKAFEEVSIDFGLITVLIGPNGTGKSSIAQALMLMKQSKGQVDLRLNGPYLYLGDYQDVIHQKSAGFVQLGKPKGDLTAELVTVELGKPAGDLTVELVTK
ncbi:MAG TPA: AAA family ATPase, partial [Dehalococcoidia bacterium]|nr:AAA family ATPase [Dehalococcoidia bacterium]